VLTRPSAASARTGRRFTDVADEYVRYLADDRQRWCVASRSSAADVGSPRDPMVRTLTTLAWIGGATLATISAVMFLRWLELHWT
jgi:hypothetical protein